MHKAIGYVRVSTEGQVVDGVSLDAQEAKIKAWAIANDADLLEVLIDAGVSGKRADNRSGLQTAIDRACREKAALIVYSLSRLSRSTKDTIVIAEKLEKAGADLVSMSEKIDTTTAAGKMVFRMLAVLSEFERDQVSERTKTALAHKRNNGEKTGGKHAPFGFDAINGKLIENAQEQTIIKTVHDLKNNGLTLRAISNELNQRGLKTKTGRNWNIKIVWKILQRKAA